MLILKMEILLDDSKCLFNYNQMLISFKSKKIVETNS